MAYCISVVDVLLPLSLGNKCSKSPSTEPVLMNVATEADKRTDSGKLLQTEGAQDLNYLFPALVLTLSINQSINFYCANIPGEARLSGVTVESVFNSKIEVAVP